MYYANCLSPKSHASENGLYDSGLLLGHDDSLTHHYYLRAWQSICMPNCLGGLGVRNMTDVNISLLTKHAWIVCTKPTRPLGLANMLKIYARPTDPRYGKDDNFIIVVMGLDSWMSRFSEIRFLLPS